MLKKLTDKYLIWWCVSELQPNNVDKYINMEERLKKCVAKFVNIRLNSANCFIYSNMIESQSQWENAF